MEIEIKSVQTIDGKKESIKQIGIAAIENYEKGTIISWTVPDEPLNFNMTILQNKILLKNQNQNMTFELEKTTKGIIKTQYGNLNMEITTNAMEVIKENDFIKRIYIDYEISIESTKSYQNEIEMTIK